MKLKIIRSYDGSGTNGVLLLNNEFFCFTIELPWKANARNISCIPEGCYEVEERVSEKHGRHLWLPKVKGRDLILLHGANDAARDLRGCIAPVFLLSGIGRGENSQLALQPLYLLVLAALKQQETVTMEIISLKTQWKKTFSIII
jgi:hypothetical protein